MLNLPTYRRRLLWCFIVIYQLTNGLLLACLAVMYGTVAQRGTLLWFLRYNFLFSKMQMFLTSVHKYVSVGYALLSIVFAYGALSIVWHSIRRRRLCYGPTPRSPTQRATSQRGRPMAAIRAVVGIFKKLAGVYLSFGLRGRYFTIGFFVREIVESALQTTQAFQSSQSLSNDFVNQSYGILIFLNCFACVVLPHLYRSDTAKGRVMCVLVDLTLDFVWGTVIPLVVFWPYLQLFYDYQNDAYVPVPIENVQKEVEFILVMSTSDFVLSTFPFVSSAANLRGIKRLLSNEKSAANSSSAADATVVASVASNGTTLSCMEHVCVGRDSCRRFCSRMLHTLFFLYGVAILIVSTASLNHSSSSSSTVSDLYECVHPMHPWLTTKQTCVGRIVNCAIAGINGSYEEIRDVLQLFDETRLSSLVFRQCPRLEVPPEIRLFRHLTVFMLQHSTVREWTAEAAVTTEFFDSLQTIRIANVTFENSPGGLIEYPLPASMEYIALRNVNMGAFIPSVGDNWSEIKYFYCDACNITKFPEIVGSMSELLELSLLFNDIPAVEDRYLEQLGVLENLWIDGSPLRSFPDALWRMSSQLGEFSFQNTNISEIPEWVDAIADKNLQIYAFGTPLCVNETNARQFASLTCTEMIY